MRAVLVAVFTTLLHAEVGIVIETEAGIIRATLDDRRAPITTANFLKYVDAGRYKGGQFHRTVRTSPDNQPRSAIKIDVIQAGVNFEFRAQDFAPIALERTRDTGLRHLDGALSMARAAPDTAAGGFFICIGSQPELDYGGKRNPDEQGFAAFGRVTAGMDVVKKIHRAKSGPSSDKAAAVLSGDQRLTTPISILSIRRESAK